MTEDVLHGPHDDDLDDDLGDDLGDDWSARPWLLDADALALAALIVATGSLMGLGLLNGGAYAGADFLNGAGKTEQALYGLIGVALALLATATGVAAAGRAQRWAGLARAAVLVGGLAVVLRVAAVVATALHDGPSFPRF